MIVRGNLGVIALVRTHEVKSLGTHIQEYTRTYSEREATV